MRDLWIDNGQGILSIDTDTLYIRLISKAKKNYRIIHSNWKFIFYHKCRYGYVCHWYYGFGGTIDEALDRAEIIIREAFEGIKKVI